MEHFEEKDIFTDSQQVNKKTIGLLLIFLASIGCDSVLQMLNIRLHGIHLLLCSFGRGKMTFDIAAFKQMLICRLCRYFENTSVKGTCETLIHALEVFNLDYGNVFCCANGQCCGKIATSTDRCSETNFKN